MQLVFVGFPPVLIPSAIQMVAPNRLRGQLGALFLFTVGIIGVSCGPLLPALGQPLADQFYDAALAR